MAAEKNNDYWRFRMTHGRKKALDPQELATEIEDYFNWVIDNPLMEHKILSTKFGIEEIHLAHPRPFTIDGLCTHIDICVKTFHNYGTLLDEVEKELKTAKTRGAEEEELKKLEEKKKEAEDYLQVITRARQIIRTQKFEGAAAGFFKEQIIIRDLGLVDKQESTIIEEQPLFPDIEYDEEDGTKTN